MKEEEDESINTTLVYIITTQSCHTPLPPRPHIHASTRDRRHSTAPGGECQSETHKRARWAVKDTR